jgi:hypothetical protein
VPPIASLTSRQYFSILSTLHRAFLIGQVLFAVAAVAVRTTGQMEVDAGKELGEILPIVALGLAIAGVAASHFLFSKRLETLRQRDGLAQKLQDYRSALILRWALLEGPVMLAIIAYMLTGNFLLLILIAAVVILFIFFRPSRSRALQDLQLPHDEEYQLTDPDAVVG